LNRGDAGARAHRGGRPRSSVPLEIQRVCHGSPKAFQVPVPVGLSSVIMQTREDLSQQDDRDDRLDVRGSSIAAIKALLESIEERGSAPSGFRLTSHCHSEQSHDSIRCTQMRPFTELALERLR